MVPGMGVEFTEVDESKRRDIEALVARLRRELEEA
jgi:type IV pilus assembly protein PilZ